MRPVPFSTAVLLVAAVLLLLQPPPCQANSSLSVSIVQPTNGTVIGPVDFAVTASATSTVGQVKFVEFWGNGVLIGRSSNAPYSVVWSDPPHGYPRVFARAYNEAFNFRDSEAIYLKVGFAPPPSISRGPYLQSGSSTSIVVRWRTDWGVDSVVRYGTNSGVPGSSITNAAPTIDHELDLTGLQADTTYFYSVGSSTQTFGVGPEYFFRTAPRSTRPVRFWVIGDAGTADDNQRAVRDAYHSATGAKHTDLFLMLGDNAYGNGLDHEYQRAVFNIYPTLLRQTPVWPTLGNHDAGDDNREGFTGERDYLSIFTLPRNGESGGVPSGSELYYSYDYANVHLVCLDSFLSDNSPTAAMVRWLEADLANTEKDWIIAYWHHAPYTWGTHESDGDYFHFHMRERVVPVLEAYGVDLVLGGHSHNYERSMLLNGHYGPSWTLHSGMILNSGFGRTNEGGAYAKPAGGIGANQGCVYAVCGCSGEGGLDEGYPLHPAMKLNRGGFGSMIIEINGLRMDVSFLRPSGAVDDYFTIDKSLDTTNRPSLQIARGTNAALVSWPTSKPTYVLESAQALATTNWQTAPSPVTTNGRRQVITLPVTGENQFLRLRKQE
jgi:hypothetical protein